MQELLVVEVIPREKGRTSIRFDNGMEVLLYKGEVRKLSLPVTVQGNGEPMTIHGRN